MWLGAANRYFQNAAIQEGPACGNTSYDVSPHSVYRRILVKTILTCFSKNIRSFLSRLSSDHHYLGRLWNFGGKDPRWRAHCWTITLIDCSIDFFFFWKRSLYEHATAVHSEHCSSRLYSRKWIKHFELSTRFERPMRNNLAKYPV
jgi:hypothetical protein